MEWPFILIENVDDLKEIANKILYLPDKNIEENCEPMNENCLIIRKFLEANVKTQEALEEPSMSLRSSDHKIAKLEEISKVIDPNINQNGNYALLEVTAEKAKKMKLGTRKILTPLKKFGGEENDKRKEGNNRAKGFP